MMGETKITIIVEDSRIDEPIQTQFRMSEEEWDLVEYDEAKHISQVTESMGLQAGIKRREKLEEQE